MNNRETSFLSRFSTPEPVPPWNVLSAFNLILVAFLGIVLGTAIAQAWFGDQQFALLGGWLVGSVITLAFIMVTRGRSKTEWPAMRAGAIPGTSLILTLLIGIGLAILLDIIGLAVTRQFLPASEMLTIYQDRVIYQQPVQLLTVIFAIALMLIIQPITEELIFRGVNFPALRAAIGAWPGLIATSLFYAVFHMAAYSSQPDSAASLWYALVAPFLSGLVLSGVRAYTGSTRAAIAAHIGFGLFALLKAFVLI